MGIHHRLSRLERRAGTGNAICRECGYGLPRPPEIRVMPPRVIGERPPIDITSHCRCPACGRETVVVVTIMPPRDLAAVGS